VIAMPDFRAELPLCSHAPVRITAQTGIRTGPARMASSQCVTLPWQFVVD